MLTLVADTLDDEGITYARYDGKMTMAERDAVIENFKSPKGPQILMLSLACGALGLNLTVAENVSIFKGSQGVGADLSLPGLLT